MLQERILKSDHGAVEKANCGDDLANLCFETHIDVEKPYTDRGMDLNARLLEPSLASSHTERTLLSSHTAPTLASPNTEPTPNTEATLASSHTEPTLTSSHTEPTLTSSHTEHTPNTEPALGEVQRRGGGWGWGWRGMLSPGTTLT